VLILRNVLWTSNCNLSKAHEKHDSLAVPVRRFSWSISIHFVATLSWNLHAPQPQIAKKLKPPILGVQGHSRSSMLTPMKSLSLLLVMISSMSCLSATVSL